MSHSNAVLQVVWPPDGPLLATMSGGGMARFWDAATGKPVGPVVPRKVTAVGFTADGKYLLTGDRMQNVRSWRVPQPVDLPAGDLPGWARELVGNVTGS
jgi:WD40 repeat protein